MVRAVVQFLLIYLIVAGFVWRESGRRPLEDIDSAFIDWLAANSPRKSTPAPLMLVEINDASMAQTGWPISPLDYSLFLQAVLPAQPGVIAIAPVVQWDDKKPGKSAEGARYERILHELILKSPKLLLGARLGHREDTDVIPPAERIPVLRNVEGSINEIPEYDVISEKPDENLALSAELGFINLRGRNSVVQRAPLVFRYRGQLVPSFTLQAAMLWCKLTLDDVTVVTDSHVQLGDKIRIPIDRFGRMLVDFSTPVSRFGYDDLLLAVAQKEINQQPFFSVEQIKAGVTMLARTDAPSRYLEFPDGQVASIGELFAEAIGTIQTESFYKRVSQKVDIAIVALFGVAGLCFLRWHPQTIVIWSVLILLFYLFAAVTIFGAQRLWMPFTLPTGLALFAMIYGFASPVRKRREKAPPAEKPPRIKPAPQESEKTA